METTNPFSSLLQSLTLHHRPLVLDATAQHQLLEGETVGRLVKDKKNHLEMRRFRMHDNGLHHLVFPVIDGVGGDLAGPNLTVQMN